jgi:predicted lipoprotein with Yx(FWY)xxD motif
MAALAAVVALGVGATAGATTTSSTLKLAYNAQLKTKIIVDAKGLTLYMFTADTKSATGCNDSSCLSIWTPMIGPATAGPGVKASLISAYARGVKQQVAYNGHQLYYFRGYAGTPRDRKPGQINGQGFYSLWYALGATGKPIKHI